MKQERAFKLEIADVSCFPVDSGSGKSDGPTDCQLWNVDTDEDKMNRIWNVMKDEIEDKEIRDRYYRLLQFGKGRGEVKKRS
jgi:hypothetical protein